jgi:hypothetical protein
VVWFEKLGKTRQTQNETHNCSSSAARAASNGCGTVSNDGDAAIDAELGGKNRLRSDEGSTPDVAATDEDDDVAEDDTDAMVGATSNVLGAFDEATAAGGEESKAEDNNDDGIAADTDACANAGTDIGSGDTDIDDAAAADISTDRPALFCGLC